MIRPPTVFLDACCINRQFDDQGQPRIQYETEAFASIMTWVRKGEVVWLGSDALRFELEQNKDSASRDAALFLFDAQCDSHIATAEDFVRAHDLQALGFKDFDSLHLAVAERLHCEVFLTTDDKLLKGAKRWKGKLNVSAENPYDWVMLRLTR
jgi:hypothetical protein